MTPEEEEDIVVDMFCGAGGECKGIDQSAKNAGANIKIYAINHWQRAIDTHQANFPGAEHICRDVHDIDPSKVIPGRKIALFWASPECLNHSNARGGKPINDQSRVTAFTILDWLNKIVVDRVIIENVPQFKFWGPLNSENRPIKEKKGEIFKAFIGMIEALDYTVEYKDLNAADFGAPTTRKRLFIQAVRSSSDKTILWPEPSHAQPSPSQSITSPLPSWIPARDIIDWTLPIQIIDERKKPLVANTMKRILRGIEKYWGDYAYPFLERYNDPIHGICSEDGTLEPLIMHIGQTSSTGRVRSINEPLATVVTKEEACLIEPLFIHQHSCGEVRPTTNPLSTVATKGAISIIEPLVINYNGNGKSHPVSEPLATVSTRDRFALITPENCRIGFRMLKPHELALAQSFPSDYKFTGNRGEIVKQIGNAVCPKIAEALTKNYMEEIAMEALV